MYGREARRCCSGLVRQETNPRSELSKQQQQQAKEMVDVQLAASQQRRARNAKSTTVIEYVQGDFVWLNQSEVKVGLSPKLRNPWSGPFRVLKSYENCTYRIKPVQVQRVY